MSRRLADLSIGSLRGTGTRRRRQAPLPTYQETTPQTTAPQIPEFVHLQQVQGITPFLTPDLIVDLIYILRLDGLTNLLNQLYPVPEDTGVSLVPEPISPEVIQNKKRRKEIIDSFKFGGLTNAINEILFPGDTPVENSPQAEEARREYLENIYQRGVQELSNLVTKANQNNPSSIIFEHSSQEIHRKTQEIEVELIMNKPEVVEREDIQCQCGSRKIQTTTKQLRSADEPPTVFYRCVECNKNWRSSSA
jgi:DNA-directed RNA polymerase subunit M/transcription elongation factor TFIIS